VGEGIGVAGGEECGENGVDKNKEGMER